MISPVGFSGKASAVARVASFVVMSFIALPSTAMCRFAVTCRC
jgi:hypothetical protein